MRRATSDERRATSDATRKRSMDKKHREFLRRNRVSLVKDLEAKQLLNYIWQEGILTDDDVDTIKAENTRSARAEKLLDIIPRRGPKAFDVFCDALNRNEGQRHLVFLLKANIAADYSGSTAVNQEQASSARRPGAFETPDNTSGSSTHEEKPPLPPGSQTPTQDGQDNNAYPMNCKPHGWCLIINNVNFTCGLNDRNGSDVDAKNLQSLFISFGYRVKTLRNLTGPALKETLFRFAKQDDHKSFDSVLVCILSHGLEGRVYGVDGTLVPISELASMFNGHQAKHLVGKPKMFFIQACRGGEYDHGADRTDSADNLSEIKSTEQILDDIYSMDEPDSYFDAKALPAEADFLLAYATAPGFVSWRNSEKGSWFIQALVDVFRDQAKDEDLVSMLIRVNGKVAREFESHGRKKQIPAPVMMLTKKVFFFDSAK